ncbi:MAG: adenine phosphoribosyltransferase [Candidatus Margulisbacteria bacterium]|nr:adenine phosphoribosyltransferase [Candidatus Margulisiibacteriota bacterium]
MATLYLNDFVRDVPDFPKPGITFKDITPLLLSPVAFKSAIDQLVVPYQDEKIDFVVSAEARGFIFGPPVAMALNAGFIPLRKPGKLPGETIEESYKLEYGTDTLQIHKGHIKPKSRILMLDDVLATGGTMAAGAKLVEKVGGTIIGFSFLIELSFLAGKTKLDGKKVHSLLNYS